MPTFQLTAPDGRQLEIEAPEGATEQQVIQYAQQQLAARDSRMERMRRENPAEYDPESEEYRDKYGAAAQSGGTNFLAGAGSGLVNVGRRAGQILTPKSLEEKLGVSDADIAKQGETDSDLLGTGWGTAGRILGEVAATAPLGGVGGGVARGVSALRGGATAARLGGMAAEGALAGELTTGEAGEGALWGAGLGAAGRLLGRAGRGSSAAQDATRQATIRDAAELGIPLRAEQIADSRIGHAITRGAEAVPLSGVTGDLANQATAWRKALAGTFGESADNLEHAVNSARARLGGAFERVLKGTETQIDDTFKRELGGILTEAKRSMRPDDFQILANATEDIGSKLRAKAGSQIADSDALYEIKKRLDKLGNGGGAVNAAAREMRDAVMDVIERGLPDAQAFRDVRRQYANMAAVRKALKAGKEAGGITPQSLASRAKLPPDVARVAKVGSLLKAPFGNSGTAERLLGAGGGVAAVAANAPAALATVAGANLANRFMRSGVAQDLVQGRGALAAGFRGAEQATQRAMAPMAGGLTEATGRDRSDERRQIADDLYQQLGVSPGASPEEAIATLKALSESDQGQAQALIEVLRRGAKPKATPARNGLYMTRQPPHVQALLEILRRPKAEKLLNAQELEAYLADFARAKGMMP